MGKYYRLGHAFGAHRRGIYIVADIIFHCWDNITAFRTMLGKGTYMVGPSKSSTLVPSGAIGVQFKLNTQLKYDSADRWGLIFDARRMLREGSAWRRMRSQG